jgi:hypothetical protein
MDPTTWVLDRIVEQYPETGIHRDVAVPSLKSLIATLEGRTGGLVFGMVADVVDGGRRAEIIALARDALAAWGELDRGGM